MSLLEGMAGFCAEAGLGRSHGPRLILGDQGPLTDRLTTQGRAFFHKKEEKLFWKFCSRRDRSPGRGPVERRARRSGLEPGSFIGGPVLPFPLCVTPLLPTSAHLWSW